MATSAMGHDDLTEETLLDKVIRLQDELVLFSTGAGHDSHNETYTRLRRELLDRPDVRDKLPDFVRRSRELGQFWHFIKSKFGTYAERRVFLWESFRPLIDYLEANDRSPGAQSIGETLESFDPAAVHVVWQKALDRRTTDPEGAITAARTLLETVCKHVLDDAGRDYSEDADLPKLWFLAAEALNLAPHQHQEQLFREILGNCQAIVGKIAAIRNRIGDAHGQGRHQIRPKARHAELVVNLAGTMASFIVATYIERNR